MQVVQRLLAWNVKAAIRVQSRLLNAHFHTNTFRKSMDLPLILHTRLWLKYQGRLGSLVLNDSSRRRVNLNSVVFSPLSTYCLRNLYSTEYNVLWFEKGNGETTPLSFPRSRDISDKAESHDRLHSEGT